MKYMRLMHYYVEGVEPITTGDPQDIKAHIGRPTCAVTTRRPAR